ncbi:MAG: acyl-CoA dehydrogenase family protein [Candidatus Binataceae bacterium]
MDLNDSIDDQEFRVRVRAFLDANLPAGWGTPAYVLPRGDEYIALLNDWQRRLSKAGFLGLAWPKEYGGAGASAAQVAIFNEETAARDAPQPPNVAGVLLAGPVIYAYGTEDQKRRHLGRILACEEIWCQGFSEPGAGSDLAALRTRAEFRGDRFVVNGQKVWTSFAHLAGWCMLLARTDPGAPKHRGLSILLVEMKTPGIEVRPLRHMTGAIEFNELFFNDVEVPPENLVGGLNCGWQVAMATLMNERGGTGLAAAAKHQRTFAAMVQLGRALAAHGQPLTKAPGFRQRMAQFYVDVQGLRHTAHRALSRMQRESVPGPEASIIKVMWSELNQRMQEFVMEMQGPASQLVEDSPRALENGRWQFEFLRSRANTIEMGTSEIHRNTIAERALGLPKSR